jgi:hypothetical protein
LIIEWGLYDMLGNVWEWCHDGERQSTADAAVDPIGLVGPNAALVIRGGSWSVPVGLVQAALNFVSPHDNRYNALGFRCARSARPERSFTIDDDRLEFESLRFYEMGKDQLPRMRRQYSDHFDSRTARYVSFELSVHNLLYTKTERTYQLAWRYYKPDGSLVGGEDTTWLIPSDLAYSWGSMGWGWEEPGHWQRGIYRVEILINGVKFVEGWFTIE